MSAGRPLPRDTRLYWELWPPSQCQTRLYWEAAESMSDESAHAAYRGIRSSAADKTEENIINAVENRTEGKV